VFNLLLTLLSGSCCKPVLISNVCETIKTAPIKRNAALFKARLSASARLSRLKKVYKKVCPKEWKLV